MATKKKKKKTKLVCDLRWGPTGAHIGTVEATTVRAAIRKAPYPYRKYLGEIGATCRAAALAGVYRRR